MGAPGIPTNFVVQTANRKNLASWDQTTGATSYVVQRSLDNVSFSTVSTITGSPLVTSYLDTSVSIGTRYYYKVAAVNDDGSSPYTTALEVIPAPTGEKSLAQLRLESQQRADRVNSNFVGVAEWNSFLNKASAELYDLLVTVYEDMYVATPITFTVDGSTFLYDLPNGANTFYNAITGAAFTPKPFYKLMGVDLAVQNTSNGYVTINKFNFIDRNRFVYPNTASTIYGVFNLQYRVLGDKIEFIPTPSNGQTIRLWYIPRLTEMLEDTDTTDIGISGWLEYVIVRAAKYALDKEESDTSKLDDELLFMKQRIEETASNRDAGQPDKISATRQSSGLFGTGGGGWNGSSGGF